MFIEQLSKDELDLIDYMRDLGIDEEGNFISSTNLRMPCTDWLQYWEESKREMFSQVFANQLILKKRINLFLEDYELHNRINQAMTPFRSTWFNLQDWVTQKLQECNDAALEFEIPRALHILFSYDTIASNVYDGKTISFLLPNGGSYKLNSGCKAMKAIGKLCKACELEETFEPIRIAQSQCLNDAHISATLCVSIHPMDYMTASWNNCNWRSCMCWEDGEYRRGVIEMMNSPYVVAVYIESDDRPLRINNQTWNSKRWREFFIVHPNMISGIKGYPFWNRGLEATALEWLRELFLPTFESKDIKLHNSIITYSVNGSNHCPPFTVNALNIKNVDIDMTCGPAMYNDFYGTNSYQCYPTDQMAHCENNRCYIDYSGASECVYCGSINSDFDNEGILGCNDCIEIKYCAICGERIGADENTFTIGGIEYCADCYYALPQCICCGEHTDPDNQEGAITFSVFVEKENEGVNKMNLLGHPGYWGWCVAEFTVCPSCLDKIFKDPAHQNFGKWFNLRGCYYRVVSYNDLTDEGKSYIDEDEINATYQNIESTAYAEYLTVLKGESSTEK